MIKILTLLIVYITLGFVVLNLLVYMRAINHNTPNYLIFFYFIIWPLTFITYHIFWCVSFWRQKKMKDLWIMTVVGIFSIIAILYDFNPLFYFTLGIIALFVFHKIEMLKNYLWGVLIVLLWPGLYVISILALIYSLIKYNKKW